MKGFCNSNLIIKINPFTSKKLILVQSLVIKIVINPNEICGQTFKIFAVNSIYKTQKLLNTSPNKKVYVA